MSSSESGRVNDGISSRGDDDLDDEDLRMDALGGRGVAYEDSDGSANGYENAMLSAATGAVLLKANLRDAKRTIKRLTDEVHVTRQECDRLRRREVEMMALSTQLHHRFQSLQLQVDNIKTTVRVQLGTPIGESEYQALEALPESERDLVSSLKIGIYQQLGLLKASRDAALRRASEVAIELDTTTTKYKQAAQELLDSKIIRENDLANFKQQLTSFEARTSQVAELTGKVKDLEAKLQGAYIEQDQLLQSKMIAAAKTNELARTQLLVKELEGEVQRYRSVSECSEQKLDILKSEFYDLRLKYTQRVAELEGQLRLSEERVKAMSDMEAEAEAFMTNIAAAMEDGWSGSIIGDPSSNVVSEACAKLACVPASRKTHHAVSVTRKCLQLDNQLVVCRSDLKKAEERCERLEKSLQLCRAALNQTHSPFALAESAVEELTKENETLNAHCTSLRQENAMLLSKVKELASDVNVLSKHRSELVRIRELLRQMGAPEAVLQSQPVPHQQAAALSPSLLASSPLSHSKQQKRRDDAPRAVASADSSIRLADPQFVPSNNRSGLLDRFHGDVLATPEVIDIC